MKKNILQQYIYLLILASMPISGFSIPVIQEVKVTHGTCRSNGTLEIVATNIQGAASYQLIAPSEVTTPPQADSYFSGLPAGNYTVAVYDGTTGATPVIEQVTLTSTYPDFILNGIGSSYDSSDVCGDNGLLYINYTGGRAPFNIKITNTNTSQVWTEQTDNQGFTLTRLQAGSYMVEVTDNCGEYRSTVSPVQVATSDNLNDVPFTSLEWTPYLYGNGGCSKIYFWAYINNNQIKINNSYNYPHIFNYVLEYRVEYPAGSGQYTEWTNMHSSYMYIYLDNYNPNVLNYNFQVKHPCTGEITSTPYLLPAASVEYLIARNCKSPNQNFCDIPESAAIYIQMQANGIANYTCANFPLTVTFEPQSGLGTQTKQYTWTNATEIECKGLDYGTNYKITIKDVSNTIVKTDWFETTIDPPTQPMVSIDLLSFYEYGYWATCNIDAMILQWSFHFLDCVPGNFFNSGKVTISVVSGPGLGIEPFVVNFDEPWNYYLWTDLPYGDYTFKLAYDCGREEYVDFVAPMSRPPYKSFGEITIGAPTNGTVCGAFNVLLSPKFIDFNDQLVEGPVFVNLYRKNSDNTKSLYTSIQFGGGSFDMPNLPGGSDYILEVHPYYSQNDSYTHPYRDKDCVLGTYEFSLPSYSPPVVNVPLSGGITCQDQNTASLTVVAAGDRPPFTYRMKPLNADDSQYTAWQSENIFPNLIPAKYTVQVKDDCGSATTQELRVFYGLDQFLYIIGEVNPGVVCAGKSTVFSVMSVGPVQYYKWYKDGVLIPGENGPSYVIENTTAADIGTYSIIINNGFCDLENSVDITQVIVTPAKPVISGVCYSNSVQLTATANDAASYRWYRDDVLIVNANASTYEAVQPGNYTVVAISSGGCVSEFSSPYYASFGTMYWSRNAADADWNNKNNWEDASGNKLYGIPSACVDVHIPGNATIYPVLTELTDPVCRNIYFHFGGEVAKPHYLTYEKAYVQYNFGYYNGSTYMTDGDAGFSATPMKRGQWYALATPLKNIASGDFSFGGKPDVWQQGFVQSTVDGDFAGAWKVPDNPNAVDVGAQQAHGISIWMAQVEQGSIGEDEAYQTNLNALQGVVQLPFYMEEPNLGGSHRIHEYVGGKSRFYYYYNESPSQTISTIYDEIARDGEGYRFAFDDLLENILIKNTIQNPSDPGTVMETFRIEVPAGKEVMIGNPFLSHLDFDAFYELNHDYLQNGTYRLYVDNNWGQEYTYGSGGSLTKYIAPLQAFFVQTAGSGTIKLVFPPDVVSVTHPSTKLRSSRRENHVDEVLYIQASNQSGNSWLTLSLRDGKDVRRLFNFDPLYTNVPQVFAIDAKKKNSVQFIQESSTIPLGIKCEHGGTITLKFDNVDGFYVESLTLLDKVLGKSVDLLHTPMYTFEGTEDMKNRFELSVGRSVLSDIEQIKASSIKIYTVRKLLYVDAGSEIDAVQVLNIQGIQYFSDNNVSTNTYRRELSLTPGIYLVKVRLVNGKVQIGKIVMR